MTYIFIGHSQEDHFEIVAELEWDAKEDFGELIKFGPIKMSDTTADAIEKIEGLSIRSKILLSAAAGAAWQYLKDIDSEITLGESPEDLEIAIEKD